MSVYDEMPYESLPIPGTCPERLALCSLLHGGPQPPLREFRVLEIGCNDGSNLLPMAFYHPDAEFVGLDRTKSALALGRAAAIEVGLSNLRLEWMDLTDPSGLCGLFDYILIHGVFSWVDANVRQNILEICSTHLAPQGVVYLSHNVQAGWCVRGLVRDVIKDAVADIPTTKGRIYRAREVASSLSGIVTESELPYHQILAAELQRVRCSSSSYLTHETLSLENVAFRHNEVVSMMADHGLEYLADALYDRPEGRLPADLGEALDGLGLTAARLEQLADVLGFRRFRSSVYCRAKAVSSALKNDGAMSLFDGLYVSIGMEEMVEGEAFGTVENNLPIDDWLATARLFFDSEWPRVLRVSELIPLSDQIVAPPIGDEQSLRQLREMHVCGRVELSLIPPPESLPCPENRIPHRLARYQAGIDQDPTTNSHWPACIGSVDRLIIVLLGEGHGVDEVAKELLRRSIAGEIAIPEDADTSNLAWAFQASVKECLQTLSCLGLLE